MTIGEDRRRPQRSTTAAVVGLDMAKARQEADCWENYPAPALAFEPDRIQVLQIWLPMS